MASDGDTTWFWAVLDRYLPLEFPSEEIEALRLLCERLVRAENLLACARNVLPSIADIEAVEDSARRLEHNAQVAERNGRSFATVIKREMLGADQIREPVK